MNETDANAIFAPLWRRKWLILAVAVLVGAGSYFYYRNKTKLFSSSTVVYLGAAAEEGAAGEKSTRAAGQSSGNQVAVINSIVIPQVKARLRRGGDPAAGAKVVAKTSEKSQFLTITAEYHTAKGTARLVNAVAAAYIKRENTDRRRSINTAIEIARRQLRRIELSTAAPTKGKAGNSSSSAVFQESTLSSHINQLEAQLSASGPQQLTPAGPLNAQLLSPKPRKNAEFGFAIGLLLASIFAYVLGRFDRRIRSLDTIESAFGAPIVTALPRVRRPLVLRDGAPSPSRNLLEPLRRLQAVLRLSRAGVAEGAAGSNGSPGAGQSAPRVVLVTSADVGDGKSTVVADLALVQREAGARVAVIDANMRRPAQARLLGVQPTDGLAESLVGARDADESMQVVSVASAGERTAAAGGGVATVVGAGSVSVLASAGGAANPPALLGSDAMAQLVSTLAQDFDSVLIDGPSPLEVSDVLPLLSLVDGVLVVARIEHTREPSAERLAQLLRERGCAPFLGVVANCVSSKQVQRYGLSSPNGGGWASSLMRR